MRNDRVIWRVVRGVERLCKKSVCEKSAFVAGRSDTNMAKLAINCLQHLMGLCSQPLTFHTFIVLRKTFFTTRKVEHWKTFLRENVSAPSLEFFKTWLNKALSSPVWSSGWSCFEQGTGLKTSWGAFQPEVFYDPIPGLNSSYFFQMSYPFQVLSNYFLGIPTQTQ